MKTVLFHSNQLGIRGTEVALYDYALYNETLLGNKSYILSNTNSDLSALKKFTNKFEVFLYKDFKECNEFALRKNATHAYFIKQETMTTKLYQMFSIQFMLCFNIKKFMEIVTLMCRNG